MRYRITALDRQTGRPVELTLDAQGPEQAERLAAARGLDVASVRPVAVTQEEAAPPAPADDGVVTIQRTAKRWKFLVLIAVLIMLLGAMLAVIDIAGNFAYPDRIGDLAIPGAIVFALGIATLVLARVLIWWHHG